MSLESELSYLQSRYAELEAERAELQAELNHLYRAAQDTNDALLLERQRIDGELDVVMQRMTTSDADMRRALQTQNEIGELYGRLKAMEQANKAIRKCNDRKYYDFAVYRQVRKIVQGMMDDLDFSMISMDVIDKAVQREQLKDPDFWLTSAMLAIVAWCDDDSEAAEKALRNAMRLDDRKTAAFFMVFNLRLASEKSFTPGISDQRELAALKWLAYLAGGRLDAAVKPTGAQGGAVSGAQTTGASSQSSQPAPTAPQGPALRGSEQSLLLLFVSMMSRALSDKVSDRTRQIVTNYVNSLIDEDLARHGDTRAQAVGRIADKWQGIAGTQAFPYDAIVSHVPGWKDLSLAMSMARGQQAILEFVDRTLTVPVEQRNLFLKDYIDGIAQEPGKQERDTYDEIRRNELIIECKGDVDEARGRFAKEKAFENAELNIVGDMIDWVYGDRSSEEVNPQMVRNMFVATKPLELEACGLYRDRYTSLVRPVQTVTVDDFTTQMPMQDATPAKQAVGQHYAQLEADAVSRVSNTFAVVLIVLGVALGVGMAFVAPPAILAGVVVAALGGITLYMNGRRRDAIHRQFAASTQRAFEQLDGLQSAFAAYLRDFSDADSLSVPLSQRIDAA
ncbi:OmpH family outer membrane protein [Pseudoscardovia radai]|uniref:OmpH family outer membrane protein n=1 Tax=Pseudoscardovia radai TaxID=987066 RepID=UPI0039937AEA